MNRRVALTAPIILASSSPRRRSLMEQAGILCTCLSTDVNEDLDAGVAPGEAVALLSKRKAFAALAAVTGSAVIIAADTLVYADDKTMGKPQNKQEAFEMLSRLQGRRHCVYTGVSLINKSESGDYAVKTFTEMANVYMRAMDDWEIDAYIATGEPFDKAGAYGVQERGAVLIERVEGDYHTVVGLPLAALYTALKEWGVRIL